MDPRCVLQAAVSAMTLLLLCTPQIASNFVILHLIRTSVYCCLTFCFSFGFLSTITVTGKCLLIIPTTTCLYRALRSTFDPSFTPTSRYSRARSVAFFISRLHAASVKHCPRGSLHSAIILPIMCSCRLLILHLSLLFLSLATRVSIPHHFA